MLGLQSAHEGNKMDVIGSFDHSFIIELRRERLHAMLQLFEQTIRANATDLQELALNLIPMENEIQVFLEKLEARPRKQYSYGISDQYLHKFNPLGLGRARRPLFLSGPTQPGPHFCRPVVSRSNILLAQMAQI